MTERRRFPPPWSIDTEGIWSRWRCLSTLILDQSTSGNERISCGTRATIRAVARFLESSPGGSEPDAGPAASVVEKFALCPKSACLNSSSRRAVRTIQTFGGFAALIAAVVFWNFGTLWPCGVLREAARQRDTLAAVLPDSIVDLGLAGHYGPLSDGRCVAGTFPH